MISTKAQFPRCNVRVNGKIVKQVRRLCYVGNCITEDGRCNEEIERRVCEATKVFQEKRNTVSNRHLSMRTRRAVKICVWSVLMYGSETWTISKKM